MHMPWNVKLNAELGFIQTVFNGTITNQDSKDAIAEALALALKDGLHMFLTDVLDAESQVFIWEIYDIPSQWESLGASRKNKLALVVPKGGRMWEDARFYETTCRNRCWQVTVFSQHQEAIDWLTGHHFSNKPGAGDD